MSKALPYFMRWSRPRSARPSTLGAGPSTRLEVCPPSLRCVPPGGGWQRLLFWLLAPAPSQGAPSMDRMPAVRSDFLAALDDIDNEGADALRQRIAQTRSLRELWHTRAEIYRIVGIARDQGQAEQRLGRLNRHFPTRVPRASLTAS